MSSIAPMPHALRRPRAGQAARARQVPPRRLARPTQRRDLAAAFALDTVAAAAATPGVAAVLVVTDDSGFAADAARATAAR